MSKNGAVREELLSLAGSPSPVPLPWTSPDAGRLQLIHTQQQLLQMPQARLSRKFLLCTGLSEPCFNFCFNSLL